MARGIVGSSEAFHTRNSNQVSSKKGNKKLNGQCFKCSKRGHWKKDCYSKTDSRATKQSSEAFMSLCSSIDDEYGYSTQVLVSTCIQ